jgi:hypothetical protein
VERNFIFFFENRVGDLKNGIWLRQAIPAVQKRIGDKVNLRWLIFFSQIHKRATYLSIVIVRKNSPYASLAHTGTIHGQVENIFKLLPIILLQ